MSIFNNSIYLQESVEPNKQYFGIVGSLQMLSECVVNDRMMFEALIYDDFLEVKSIHENADIDILSEGKISEFIDKIKELAKKAWEKIVGIYNSIIAKINGVITRDTKKLYNKYKNKFDSGNFNDFKYKYSKPKNALEMPDFNGLSAGNYIQDLASPTYKPESVEKLEAELKDDGVTMKMIDHVLKGTSLSDFTKEMHEYYFDDEEKCTGLSSDVKKNIEETLNATKVIKDLKSSKSKSDKYFKSVLSAIDKAKSQMDKVDGGYLDIEYRANQGDEADTKTSIMYTKRSKSYMKRKLACMYGCVSSLQKVTNMFTQAAISANKFNISQCRRIFTQAVSYASMHHEQAYLEAMGDIAEYEVESAFEDYSI